MIFYIFFYNSLILIKLHKIRYLNLDKALLFPRDQAIWLKNGKLWRASTTTKFNIFSWNFAQVFYLQGLQKGVRVFLILFRSWVINKNVKNECAETRSFWSRKRVGSFGKKILNSMVVGARQSFQFSRQKTWFLENNRALSKFLYGVLHYLISIQL